jgi:peptidoglycan biosynthesis protein MviN/MurJ (putative lipid II flippase)
VAFTLNISLGYLLMQTELRHAGLALANTVSVTVQMLLLIIILQKRIGAIDFRSFFISLAKYGIASAVMVLVIIGISGRYDWIRGSAGERVRGLALIVVSGGLAYAFMCFILKVEEMRYLINKIKFLLQKKS